MDHFGNQNCFASYSYYPQHECNIICGKKFSLNGKKGERKQKQAEAWKRQQLRLQLLAAPRKRASKLTTTNEVKGVAISKLLPRLKVLSQPRCITQKYVKRPETPFELPGKIKDWESHKNWLKLRAQPRRFQRKVVLPVINESNKNQY
ncbi:hypothetical protein ACKWTF_013698 [Chironomus riparius]